MGQTTTNGVGYLMKRNILFACALSVFGALALLVSVNVMPLVLLFPSPQVASTLLSVIAFSPTAIFIGKKLSEWMNDRARADRSDRARLTASGISSGPTVSVGKSRVRTSRLSQIARALFQRPKLLGRQGIPQTTQPSPR
jgi:hypothetical protein